MRAKDVERLARFFAVSAGVFLDRYAEVANGKRRLKAGQGGSCVFFSPAGCSVHPAKPDVCRAWPFFRGNVTDPLSFSMAKEACPGIRPEAAFGVFSRLGAVHLLEEALFVARNEEGCPTALMPKTDLLRLAGEGVFAPRGAGEME